MEKINLECPTHQMFSGLGAGNIGDEVMILGFWNCLEPTAGSTVEIWDSNSPVVRWFPSRYTYLPWTDNKVCQEAVLAANLVLLVGATPVTADLGLDWPLRALSTRLLFCHANNIPVHAIGVGVDFLSNAEAINIFNEAFAPIKTWTVRSSKCRSALTHLGVSDSSIMVGADLAWLYKQSKDLREWALDKWETLGLDLKRPLIGINVVNEVWQENMSAKKVIALALEKIIKRTGAQIIFVCNEIRQGKFFDTEAARQMMSLINEPCHLLPTAYYQPDEIVALFSHLSVVVSQRYHVSIEAILAGTVPVSFARGQKMTTLIDELKMTPVGTMTEVEEEVLYSAVIDAIERRTYWLNHLHRIRRLLEERAWNNLFFMRRLS